MGDISLRGQGIVKYAKKIKRKKFGDGTKLSRRGFLGVMTGLAATPELIKGLKSEKKVADAIKVAKVAEKPEIEFSMANRNKLIKKFNDKTITEKEKELLENWDIMVE